jgi:hypothetical protein
MLWIAFGRKEGRCREWQRDTKAENFTTMAKPTPDGALSEAL